MIYLKKKKMSDLVKAQWILFEFIYIKLRKVIK